MCTCAGIDAVLRIVRRLPANARCVIRCNRKYDSDYVTKYVEENTSFETVMQHVKALFGLMAPNDPEATEDSKLLLTDYEYGLLEAAYQKTMNPAIRSRHRKNMSSMAPMNPFL